MQQITEGKLIPFTAALSNHTSAIQPEADAIGQTLLMEPRTVRHQERVEDLFYLLFKRTGT